MLRVLGKLWSLCLKAVKGWLDSHTGSPGTPWSGWSKDVSPALYLDMNLVSKFRFLAFGRQGLGWERRRHWVGWDRHGCPPCPAAPVPSAVSWR